MDGNCKREEPAPVSDAKVRLHLYAKAFFPVSGSDQSLAPAALVPCTTTCGESLYNWSTAALLLF